MRDATGRDWRRAPTHNSTRNPKLKRGGAMSRKQGPHFMGMRPAAICASGQQRDVRTLSWVVEAAP